MEQSELNRNQLVHPTGCDTKKLLAKKGIEERKPLRYIKAKSGTWFGCNEPFESEERDKELLDKFLDKINASSRIVKIFILLLISNFTSLSQTIINSSYVSGYWSVSGSPYIVENDISIFFGQSLTIESGVSVKFNPETNLVVNGELIADSVTFEALDTTGWFNESSTAGGWNGIHFMPSVGVDNSVFQNNVVKDCKFGYSSAVLYTNALTCNRKLNIYGCLFEHNTSGTGVYVSDGVITLAPQSNTDTILFNNCIVRNCKSVFGFVKSSNYYGGFTSVSNSKFYDNTVGSVIYGSWNNLLIYNNDIYNNHSSLDNSAIKLSIGTALIKNNRIHHNSCEQLATIGCRSGKINIENNLICNNIQTDSGCGELGGGGAIHLAHNEGSSLFENTYYIVRNNVIANNYSNYGGGAVYAYNSRSTISNNQIVNNSSYDSSQVLISGYSSEVYMRNNLFFNINNTSGINILSANQIEFNYNFIQDSLSEFFINSSFLNLVGDTLNNVIGEDPEMILPTLNDLYTTNATMSNFNINALSPCINKGDTAYAFVLPFDYLNNPRIIEIIDIGAYEYQNNLDVKSINEKQMTYELTIFPNPAQVGSTISVKTNDNSGIILLYDIQGNIVKQFNVDSFYTVCDLSGINSGVYFISKSNHAASKLIIKGF